MVAAISTDKTNLNLSTPTSRPSLLPSEKGQQQQQQKHNNVPSKKPRGKQVPSRYLSPSPSSSSTTSTTSTTTTSTTTSSSSHTSFTRRYPSPLSRPANSGSSSSPLSSYKGSKRSQSVDRRRGGTPRPVTLNPESKQGNACEMSAATRMLITSTRSLSVSFQGEAFSLPISKAKVAAAAGGGNGNGRKVATPERRRPLTPGRDQGENFKTMDQHRRWPGRSREGNLGENKTFLSRSLDYGGVDNPRGVTGSALVGVKSSNQENSALVDEVRRFSFDFGNAKQNLDANSLIESSFSMGDLTASDSDSVSSGSTSGAGQEFGSKGRSGGGGIAVSARFWQESNSRLRRLQDSGSPLSTSPASRIGAASKGIPSKRFSSDGPLASPRTMASPIRGVARPASPSKLWVSTASSPLRALSSPLRVRPMSSNSGGMPSILSFTTDLRRGKIGEERIVDAHALRLLYNHYLQWRFVNARADATFTVQRLSTEKNLWNAWVKISELRHTVTFKKMKLLLLRQKLKLSSILKGQIPYLEDLSLLDRDHLSFLEGVTEALKASTLRLPVVGEAIVDVVNLKDAVGSAVDVLQAMASSICSLSTKVEEMNALMAELVNITANERVLLEQCKDFLSLLAAMKVTHCSLRTHIIQVHRLPTTTSLTTPV